MTYVRPGRWHVEVPVSQMRFRLQKWSCSKLGTTHPSERRKWQKRFRGVWQVRESQVKVRSRWEYLTLGATSGDSLAESGAPVSSRALDLGEPSGLRQLDAFPAPEHPSPFPT